MTYARKWQFATGIRNPRFDTASKCILNPSINDFLINLAQELFDEISEATGQAVTLIVSIIWTDSAVSLKGS
jgi:hypothetical protein